MSGTSTAWQRRADQRTGKHNRTLERAMTRTNLLNTATVNFLERDLPVLARRLTPSPESSSASG